MVARKPADTELELEHAPVEANEIPETFAAPAVPKKLTWAALRAKPVRTRTFDFYLGDEKYQGTVQAISQRDYDALLEQCPPTKEQREQGASFDEAAHGPKLIAACFVEPALTLDQATELFTSPQWNRGEVAELYRECLQVNHTGVSTPF